MFDRIDHIGVAVEEIDAALELYRDSFELELAHREIVERAGRRGRAARRRREPRRAARAARRRTRRSGKFLATQGPGLHHVAYQVDDIDATLDALKQAGLELIDEQPRIGIRGSRVAFLHPRVRRRRADRDRRARRREAH